MAQTATRKFFIANKKPVKGVLLVLLAGALAAPYLLVRFSALQDGWTTTMRTAGILAYTLIFLNLVTGPMSRWFYLIFKPRRVQAFHIVTGVAGFSLAVLHGVIVFVLAHYRDHPATWLIGPITLGLLVVTIVVAFEKKRLPHLWRRIHQLNYLIFVAVFVKAVLIGSTLASGSATGTATTAVMSLEMAIVVLATATRIRDYTASRARRKAREVEKSEARTSPATCACSIIPKRHSNC